MVLRDADRRTWYGAWPSGIFVLHIWFGSDDVRERVADFIRYENTHGRIPVLVLPEDVDADRFVEEALADVPAGATVRERDPRWIVHSTTDRSWLRIKADGELRALSGLPSDNTGSSGLGFRELGEPPEFADYVVLAGMDSLSPEIVVSSGQRREICEDPDVQYVPGVRLYFDCRAIIESGLAVRDGLHTLKVHRSLPLSPFLVFKISRDEAVLPEAEGEWTPRSFTAAANAAFLREAGGGD
jgi:hypothetical protein